MSEEGSAENLEEYVIQLREKIANVQKFIVFTLLAIVSLFFLVVSLAEDIYYLAIILYGLSVVFTVLAIINFNDLFAYVLTPYFGTLLRLSKGLSRQTTEHRIVSLILLAGLLAIFSYFVLKMEFNTVTYGFLVAVFTIIVTHGGKTPDTERETDSNNELDFVNEQMKELYSPLKSRPTILQITEEEFFRLKEKSYLASGELRELLDEYFKTMETSGKRVQTRLGERLNLEHDTPNFVDLKERFDKQVNTDYDMLSKKLEGFKGETKDS